MKVCIGGTFDRLHDGHKYLINKAFEIAGQNGSVFIGLTTDRLVKVKKDIKPFYTRKKNLEEYLCKKGFRTKFIIKSINDKYGPSITGEFDAIVVSPETVETAEEINIKRKKIGNKPLKIIQISFILTEDKKPISSSRIRKKEIDEEGKILI